MPSVPPPSPPPLRFVTWNCLSALPQFYETLRAQPPTVDLRPSLAHNRMRHRAIVEALTPHVEQLASRSLDAVVLQEVDHDLADDLERLAARIGGVRLCRPDGPYVRRAPFAVSPDGATYDFNNWLLTLVRDEDLVTPARPAHRSRAAGPPGRFQVTRLRQCTVVNLHLPWVRDDVPDYAQKRRRSEATVRIVARHFPHHPQAIRRSSRRGSMPPTVVVGDLNLSCPLNQELFRANFTAVRGGYRVCGFGESYRLDPEHLAGHTTFAGIETAGVDDGVVVAQGWDLLRADHPPLKDRLLPVDARGWFLARPSAEDARRRWWPSDHGLVEVAVVRRRPVPRARARAPPSPSPPPPPPPRQRSPRPSRARRRPVSQASKTHRPQRVSRSAATPSSRRSTSRTRSQ